MGLSDDKTRSNPRGAPLPALPIDYSAPGKSNPNFGRDLANWLFPVYLAAILLGFWVIKSSTPGASNPSRALFTAINAATLTGFSNGFPIDKSLSEGGQTAVLALVIMGSLFSMTVCSLAMVRVLRLRYSDRAIILGAFVAEAAALAIGGVAFFNADNTLSDAVTQGASAFGNCGVYAGTLPGVDQAITHLVLLPLALLGGLGLPVLMEFLDCVLRRKPMSKHSMTAISMTAWIYVIAFALLMLLDIAGRKSVTVEGAMQSSATVLESRTSGLPLVSPRTFARVGQWIVMGVMAIGASSGGTGGGLKTTTVAELIRGTRAAIDGKPVTRAFGFALAWLAFYGAIVVGAAMLLSYVMPESSADGVLFNAVSGASNVGLSPAEIPDRANVYYALSAIMLLGRMAPAMILWWMAESNVVADVAIG